MVGFSQKGKYTVSSNSQFGKLIIHPSKTSGSKNVSFREASTHELPLKAHAKESLAKQCYDGGMSYAERAAKREARIGSAISDPMEKVSSWP